MDLDSLKSILNLENIKFISRNTLVALMYLISQLEFIHPKTLSSLMMMMKILRKSNFQRKSQPKFHQSMIISRKMSKKKIKMQKREKKLSKILKMKTQMIVTRKHQQQHQANLCLRKIQKLMENQRIQSNNQVNSQSESLVLHQLLRLLLQQLVLQQLRHLQLHLLSLVHSQKLCQRQSNPQLH